MSNGVGDGAHRDSIAMILGSVFGLFGVVFLDKNAELSRIVSQTARFEQRLEHKTHQSIGHELNERPREPSESNDDHCTCYAASACR